LAYAGIDNRAAGETAAWLIAMTVRERPARVLVVQSSAAFRGEGDRVTGFAAAIRARHRHLAIATVSEGFGRDHATAPLIAAALSAHPDIAAVYSVGGGNRAIIAEFDRLDRRVDVFVAHDLDADNRALLAARRIHFVLNHDLRTDVRNIYSRLLAPGGPAGADGAAVTSAITVHTPFNMP
ncbi:MAG: substrate-binding domain-containing protein, partial [Rhizobiaceae bacterium]